MKIAKYLMQKNTFEYIISIVLICSISNQFLQRLGCILNEKLFNCANFWYSDNFLLL